MLDRETGTRQKDTTTYNKSSEKSIKQLTRIRWAVEFSWPLKSRNSCKRRKGKEREEETQRSKKPQKGWCKQRGRAQLKTPGLQPTLATKQNAS